MNKLEGFLLKMDKDVSLKNIQRIVLVLCSYHKDKMKSIFSDFFILFVGILCYLQFSTSKFLLLVDDNAANWVAAFRSGSSDFDDSTGSSFEFRSITYINDSNWDEVCQMISSGVSAVIDLTHQLHGESKPNQYFRLKSIPYYKIEIPTDTLIKGANAFMEAKSGSNGFLIFHSDIDVNRGVHLILGNTAIRYAFLNAMTMGKLIIEKFDYRIPSGVLVFGNAQHFDIFVKEKYSVIRNLTDWIFSFNSFQIPPPNLNISFAYFRGYFDGGFCCPLINNPTTHNNENENNATASTTCNPSDCDGDPVELYLKRLAFIFSETLKETGSKVVTLNCKNDNEKGDSKFLELFSQKLTQKCIGLCTIRKEKLLVKSKIIYEEVYNGTVKRVGQYSEANGFERTPNYTFWKRPPYYRIGIVEVKPWTYRDDETGEWIGYCIDLAKEIAKKMNFTWDFVESHGFGNRDNVTGRWDGLTGDLIHGKIDIAIAAYIMLSEREEYIDFVSPYFEQSGLIIAMQRPLPKNSLFKFMTVLKFEVWISIAGATIATGFMLWFLDKFSPYSAQNNPHKYKQFRKFTLKESFWFALTSFTPQGGGEPPKAFSGRMLVAAYWIFVVLMLATFTANLAAFLTVERMQSPIRNLEHLASQSSVQYSVVWESTARRFFFNMAKAEEELYLMWRNLTLTAPSSNKEYIVWEYPVREMYIHIKSVIEKTKYVKTYEEGLQKAATDQYYAFIHDAAQTKYEVYRNCNLTLIGDPFAESPYAIAVAQGNPLQDNISMAILELQTDRFFETLSTKYWSSTCNAAGEGDGDGISLESLGGVFIATIIGLGIAFISLAFEVFTTARNRRKAKVEAESIKPKFIVPMDFYGTSKKFEKKFKQSNFLPDITN